MDARLWLALAAIHVGCRSPEPEAASVAGSVSVESLAESLTPLRTRFNDDKGLLRFIALLSPT